MATHDDLTDLIGDIVALRIVAQRLYALFALAARADNKFLDQQRQELLDILGTWKIGGNTSEGAVKIRAETCINSLFDDVRINYHPPS